MNWIRFQFFYFIMVWYIASTLSNELGSPCAKDTHCKVDNSHSFLGVCQCKHYHAQLGSIKCLESKLLGRECLISEQCSLRVANSICREGHCHCSQGFIRFRKRTCLGYVCYNDEHCRLWSQNSHCEFLIPKLFGKCICDGEGNCKQFEATKPSEVSGMNETEITIPPAEFSNEGEHLQLGNDKESIETKRLVNSTILHKYRVEASEMGMFESSMNWSPVNAVSLGYECRLDVECQKKDSQSRCLDGVCDCVVKINKTNSCSRNCTGCGPETFQCRESGICISWFFVCDGRDDCSDKSDEECRGPKCPEPSFQCEISGACVSLAVICDGVNNCPNGEDEYFCANDEKNSTRERDLWDTFYQKEHLLPLPFNVRKFEFCNALPKCSDGSDESPQLCSSHSLRKRASTKKIKKENCPFECANGSCRSTAIVCSRRDGCGDNSDEAHCTVCSCPKILAEN